MGSNCCCCCRVCRHRRRCDVRWGGVRSGGAERQRQKRRGEREGQHQQLPTTQRNEPHTNTLYPHPIRLFAGLPPRFDSLQLSESIGFAFVAPDRHSPNTHTERTPLVPCTQVPPDLNHVVFILAFFLSLSFLLFFSSVVCCSLPSFLRSSLFVPRKESHRNDSDDNDTERKRNKRKKEQKSETTQKEERGWKDG